MTSKKNIGIVKPKIFKSLIPLRLQSGKILKEYNLIYETYGTLNKNKDNTVVVLAWNFFQDINIKVVNQ